LADPGENTHGVIWVQPGAKLLNVQLTIDRVEGEKKQIAVMPAEDGAAIAFPTVLVSNEGHR
jgi:hypothetical protein